MPITSSSSSGSNVIETERRREDGETRGEEKGWRNAGNNNDLSIIVKSLLITLMVQKILKIFYESKAETDNSAPYSALLRRLVWGKFEKNN